MTTDYHFELSLVADQIRGCVVCVCVWSHIPPWSPGIGTNCWLIGRKWLLAKHCCDPIEKSPAKPVSAGTDYQLKLPIKYIIVYKVYISLATFKYVLLNLYQHNYDGSKLKCWMDWKFFNFSSTLAINKLGGMYIFNPGLQHQRYAGKGEGCGNTP